LSETLAGVRTADLVAYLEALAARVKEERAYLTALDSPIGDADHGTNLDRGFSAVAAKLPDMADQDLGAILRMVGTTLVSTVGGASGPLYGTAFLRAGAALAGHQTASLHDIVAALRAALDGIMQRGKAQRGEKTMIDAIAPAVEAVYAALARGAAPREAAREAVAAAEEGMRSTIPMLATKGRASYLGERSIGHQDPGATSAYLMARVALEIAEGRGSRVS
jgi:dihydroxyacetone kinase-like protein